MGPRLAALVSLAAAATSGCEKKAEALQGPDLFARSCARCHGIGGTGGLPLSEGGPVPRDFREHAFHASRTDEQIKHSIVHGKGDAMPSFGAAFSDAELAALVRHVRSFDSQKETPK